MNEGKRRAANMLKTARGANRWYNKNGRRGQILC